MYLIILYLLIYIVRKNNELTNLKIRYQKEYDMAKYYKKLFMQSENQQILIHDIRKHLLTISKLNKQNKSLKIQSYLNQLLDFPELQNSVHISDNEMLNSIICRYIQICQIKHIKFKTDIRKLSLTCLDYSDLTALLGNLLENSIEACTDIPDSYIELNISTKENTSISIINVVNTCRISPEFDKSGRPQSTKKNRFLHGVGLKSIERVVAKYNGSIKMYFDKDTMTFHTIIIIKGKTPRSEF